MIVWPLYIPGTGATWIEQHKRHSAWMRKSILVQTVTELSGSFWLALAVRQLWVICMWHKEGISQLWIVHVVCCCSCIVFILEFDKSKSSVLSSGIIQWNVDILDVTERYEGWVQLGLIDALFQSYNDLGAFVCKFEHSTSTQQVFAKKHGEVWSKKDPFRNNSRLSCCLVVCSFSGACLRHIGRS